MVIIGNIGIHQYGERIILALKIGVRDLVPNAPIMRPHFAYLLTDKSSTGQINNQSREGDEGYRLIVVNLEDSVTALLLEMADAGKVTIAFNRREAGMDVLVPVDLMVHDAEYASSGAVMRKRSPDSIMKFFGLLPTNLGASDSKTLEVVARGKKYGESEHALRIGTLSGCAPLSNEERVQRDAQWEQRRVQSIIKRHSPMCEALGAKPGTDRWGECIQNARTRPSRERQRKGLHLPYQWKHNDMPVKKSESCIPRRERHLHFSESRTRLLFGDHPSPCPEGTAPDADHAR